MTKYIIPAIEKTLPLTKWDETGETWVKVRQIRSGDQHRYEEETYTREISYNQGEESFVTEKQRISVMRIYLVRAKLAVLESNLAEAVLDPKTGEPKVGKNGEIETRLLFTRNMSEAAFTRSWNSLPVELVQEIDEKIRELNPHWGNREQRCPECGYTGDFEWVERESLGED